MTPDIEIYAPAIEAVFDTVPPERRIPFTIADRSLGAESAHSYARSWRCSSCPRAATKRRA